MSEPNLREKLGRLIDPSEVYPKAYRELVVRNIIAAVADAVKNDGTLFSSLNMAAANSTCIPNSVSTTIASKSQHTFEEWLLAQAEGEGQE